MKTTGIFNGISAGMPADITRQAPVDFLPDVVLVPKTAQITHDALGPRNIGAPIMPEGFLTATGLLPQGKINIDLPRF